MSVWCFERVVNFTFCRCAVLLLFLLSPAGRAYCSESIIAPGSTVRLHVENVQSTAWVGQPLWKAAAISVKPHPLVLPDKQEIIWSASNIGYEHPSSVMGDEVNLDGDWSQKKDLPDNREYEVNVEFSLPSDNRLFGKTLSFDVEMEITSIYCEAERGWVDKYGNPATVNIPNRRSDHITKTISFTVATAAQIRAAQHDRIEFYSISAVAIVLFFALLAFILRVSSRPKGISKALNGWRSTQKSRLTDTTVCCPYCQTTVELTEKCSHCNKSILRGRLLTRIILLLIPAFIIFMLLGLIKISGAFLYLAKNLAQSGAIGLVIVFVLISFLRHFLSEMIGMLKGAMSALLLPASGREKYLRAANRIAKLESASDEMKARAYGLTLCQDYSPLNEFHTSGDQSCGVTFWKEKQAAEDISEPTRSVLNDLVFVEVVQDCMQRGYRPADDPRFDSIVATASDSDSLIEAAQILSHNRGDFSDKFFAIIGPKIEEKAPNLAAILTQNTPQIMN